MKLFTLVVTFVALVAVDARRYAYQTYEEIAERIEQLQVDYPELISVTTAQEKYGLASTGQCGSRECLQYIVHITNKAKLTDLTPEVLFSGELHGNERTGPGITMEMIQVLLDGYGTNEWITHLVDTRSVYIMPMTNAQGYYKNRREENGYDPNRDFPGDSPQRGCMNTIAARAINELSREHLFQMSVSYHGGIQLIGYNWGSTEFSRQTISPDDVVQRSLGSIFSATAGKYREGSYPHGRINDILYSVRGAYEVWTYAASWWKNPSGPCTGTALGQSRYPTEKTTYDPVQMNQISILIETSRYKTPPSSQLGTDDDVLRVEGAGDGHFPRNIRIGLAAIDLVEPYLKWVEDAASTETFTVRPGAELPLSYEVGGAMNVDATRLLWGRAPQGADFSEPGFGLSPAELEDFFDSENGNSAFLSKPGSGRSSAQSGLTRWSGGGFHNSAASKGPKLHLADDPSMVSKTANLHSRSINPFIPAWTGNLRAPTTEGEYFVIATAMVDEDWSKPTDPSVLNEAPFSHLVNARTNPGYERTLGQSKVVGRTSWYSKPIRVVVSRTAQEMSAVVDECTDASPSNVELLGRVAECSELKGYCDSFDFVRTACPDTCNACANGTIERTPLPQAPQECDDVGGIEAAGDALECSFLKPLCDTNVIVAERCSRTCGLCRPKECVDVVELKLVFGSETKTSTCAEAKEQGWCFATEVSHSCPITCGTCPSGVDAGLQLSPIIPKLATNEVAGLPSTEPGFASRNAGSTLTVTSVMALVVVLAMGSVV